MLEAFPVSGLTGYLKERIESDPWLSDIWVEGEVSNLSRSSAGHSYFTLKDEQAQIRCVMFRRSNTGGAIENGTQVLTHGNVALYQARGDLQLVVDFVQPAGIGARQAELERLKDKLEAEGLFDPTRKRSLPAFPRRIGVATSPTGAVFHDIRHVIGRRWPLTEIVLAPTPVQGTEAAAGICEAIRQLNGEADIDVIIIARGGGSLEELWPFNDEAVARAVYGSRLPVVSGVGHETHYTIVDYVADLRAPTPSAAAESSVPNQTEMSLHIERMALSLLDRTGDLVNHRRADMERAWQQLQWTRPDPSRNRERVAALIKHAQSAFDRGLEQRIERLNGSALQLRSLDASRTLARGYAVVQGWDDKQVITSVRKVQERERLNIHVADGQFSVEVSRPYGF